MKYFVIDKDRGWPCFSITLGHQPLFPAGRTLPNVTHANEAIVY